MNKTIVIVSAPGKLMLFGEHAVVFGRPCIVTAVDQRIYTTIERVGGTNLVIDAPQLSKRHYSTDISKLDSIKHPKEFRFVIKAVGIFFKKYKVSSGLTISTKSEFSSLFGFGSSSAVTVCVIKALSNLFDIEVDNKALFDIAYKTVLDVQGVGSGFDLAAAIWGGTLYFVTGGREVKPIKVGKLPIVVGYTGIKADTALLVKKVGNFRRHHKKEVEEMFDRIEDVVEEAKIALAKGDYKKVGILANINQGLLDSLGVSTKELSDLIVATREKGAYGSKLSGAGGGDCMISFVGSSKLQPVKRSIGEAGGTVLNVKFGSEGVRIEKR